MVVPRMLFDFGLAQNVIGLPKTWMNLESPVVVGRAVLQPLMCACTHELLHEGAAHTARAAMRVRRCLRARRCLCSVCALSAVAPLLRASQVGGPYASRYTSYAFFLLLISVGNVKHAGLGPITVSFVTATVALIAGQDMLTRRLSEAIEGRTGSSLWSDVNRASLAFDLRSQPHLWVAPLLPAALLASPLPTHLPTNGSRLASADGIMWFNISIMRGVWIMYLTIFTSALHLRWQKKREEQGKSRCESTAHTVPTLSTASMHSSHYCMCTVCGTGASLRSGKSVPSEGSRASGSACAGGATFLRRLTSPFS
jgi:hypothetical protein